MRGFQHLLRMRLRCLPTLQFFAQCWPHRWLDEFAGHMYYAHMPRYYTCAVLYFTFQQPCYVQVHIFCAPFTGPILLECIV